MINTDNLFNLEGKTAYVLGGSGLIGIETIRLISSLVTSPSPKGISIGNPPIKSESGAMDLNDSYSKMTESGN